MLSAGKIIIFVALVVFVAGWFFLSVGLGCNILVSQLSISEKSMRTAFKNQIEKEKYEKTVKDRLRALEERRAIHASKKIPYLKVTITAVLESENLYKVSISNAGTIAHENIRIRYEIFILWAENFGLDTTHVPLHAQFSTEEPIIIEALPPNTTIEFQRTGCNLHRSYRGPRHSEIYITGSTEQFEGFPLNNFNWCDITVDLPNASGKRNI